MHKTNKRNHHFTDAKIFVVSLLIMISALWAQGQTVDFDPFDEPWDSIVGKAQSLGKPIFVDVYTDWCGPCKWMDLHVFNQPEAGAFINTNFLPIKINGEMGHGVDFINRYNINSYPTYLFFGPDGSLVLTGMGSMQTDHFLKMAHDALENLENGVSLEQMKRQITEGKADPDFIMRYIRQLSAQRQPNALLIEDYLRALPADSLHTPAVLSLVKMGYVGRMPTTGRAFAVLHREYERYPVKSWELMSPWNTIRNRLFDYVDSAGRTQDTTWLAEILEANATLDDHPIVAERERLYMLCRYFAHANDRINFMQHMERFADRFVVDMDIEDLNGIDQAAFDQALSIKFGTNHPPDIDGKAYADFRRTYYSEARIIGDEMMHIASLYKRFFPLDFLTDRAPKIQGWISRSFDFYRSNAVFMDEDYLKLKMRSYDRLIEQ